MKYRYLSLFNYGIMLLSVFLLFSYFKLQNRNDFSPQGKGIEDFYIKGIVCNSEVEDYIEADYFCSNNIQNGDFADGLSHWAILNNKNFFQIDTVEYGQNVPSLKITVNDFPCRLYYSKASEFVILDALPWGFKKNRLWMGVRPGGLIKVGLLCKDIGPEVYINMLEKGGHARVLTIKKVEKSPQWRQINFSTILPEDARAISLEITLNEESQGKIGNVDDIQLEVFYDNKKNLGQKTI